MAKVCFLIPASPTASFFSQIAAFQLAVRRLRWQRWTPSVRAIFGGPINSNDFLIWENALRDVDLIFLSQHRFERDGLFAQGDARFAMLPEDADVVVMADADTMLTGSVECVLDDVLAKNAIAGVIAHYPFPRFPGFTARTAWLDVAEGVIDRPLSFNERYSLQNFTYPDTLPGEQACPFYVNFGAVFIAGSTAKNISGHYRAIRRAIEGKLQNSYFSAQVALTLSVTELQIPTISLSMAYNFPNDPIAEAAYPDALADVRVFHYLRTEQFNRSEIFNSPENYQKFLSTELSGSNAVFQNFIRTRFGETFPFRSFSD